MPNVPRCFVHATIAMLVVALLASQPANAQQQANSAGASPLHPTADAWGSQPVISQSPAASETSPIAAIAVPPTGFADPNVQPAQAAALSGHDPFAGPASPKLRWPPPGGRDTAFQRVTFESSHLPAFEDDSLGISALRTSVMFALPFPTRDSPILITPGYETLFLEGPTFTDVPPRLNAATLDLSTFRLLSDRWLLNVAATVGVYADDHSFSDSNAVRVTGRALGIYQWTHEWKAIVGLVYLNRGDFSVIPAVGLQYDNGQKKIDLVFPRPKIAWRIDGGGRPGPGAEQHWLFIGGEFGGNEWAVRRTTGASDTLDYSDLRVQLGYEVKRFGGLSTKYEVGYVFARELELASDGFESSLDDTLFARVGFSY